MMSQRICKNCLESFDSNGVSWYCSECGESKRQLPESVRVARANRARKICSVCGKKFGMSDAGIDPSVAAERRGWNGRTRCGSPDCDKKGDRLLVERHKRLKRQARVGSSTDQAVASELRALITAYDAISPGQRDPRYEQYEIMMGKRRRL